MSRVAGKAGGMVTRRRPPAAGLPEDSVQPPGQECGSRVGLPFTQHYLCFELYTTRRRSSGESVQGWQIPSGLGMSLVHACVPEGPPVMLGLWWGSCRCLPCHLLGEGPWAECSPHAPWCSGHRQVTLCLWSKFRPMGLNTPGCPFPRILSLLG